MIKKLLRSLFYIILPILYVSACGVPYYLNSEGSSRPRNPNFKLKGALENFNGTYLVDTNAVYLNIDFDIHAGPFHFDTLYHFDRYFPDGHYFSSGHFEQIPTKEDFEKLEKGTIGYYTLKGSEILIEIFTRNAFGAYFLTNFEWKGI